MIDLTKIPSLPQRQDSLNDQLDDLQVVAAKLGMYDAHQWLTDLIRLRARSERERGIPRGYKRVARPCPHHVPCADPQGCSGHEVVPNSDPRPSID